MLDRVSRCALIGPSELEFRRGGWFRSWICLLFMASSASAAPLNLYVLAGQSNMSGWGRVDELSAEAIAPQADVLYHTAGAGFGLLRATDDDFGPEIEFGRTMSAALLEPIAIVKHAVGSTSLAEDWNPSQGDNLYSVLMDRVELARQYWTTAGYEVQVAGVVWMHGEEDARREAMAPHYEANLLNFIDQILADLQAPDAPFVFGQIRGAAFAYREIVRDAQAAVDQAGVGAYLVETDDLTSWEGLHFDTASQLTLGRRFATAMLGARSDVPGDANGDGQVGIDDLNAVRNNFAGFGEGDVTRDGLIGIDDLNLVRNQFGVGIDPNANVVPEPSTLAISIVAAAYVRRRLAAAITTAGPASCRNSCSSDCPTSS